MADASASQPTMREISWTNALTSLEGVPFDRSWLNLALRQGWFETWTLFGRVDMVFAGGRRQHRSEGLRGLQLLLRELISHLARHAVVQLQ